MRRSSKSTSCRLGVGGAVVLGGVVLGGVGGKGWGGLEWSGVRWGGMVLGGVEWEDGEQTCTGLRMAGCQGTLDHGCEFVLLREGM